MTCSTYLWEVIACLSALRICSRCSSAMPFSSRLYTSRMLSNQLLRTPSTEKHAQSRTLTCMP